MGGRLAWKSRWEEGERCERRGKKTWEPWVELLVSIYDLLHNRSRAVSREGEISAAKMGRWRGKTWLEFAPRRGRATASSGTAKQFWPALGPLQKAGVALLVAHRGPFSFPCRDCVTVFRSVIPLSLATSNKSPSGVVEAAGTAPPRVPSSPAKTRRRHSALGQLINKTIPSACDRG